ncbi:MAG: hypothetical protein KDA92_15135 [Planctomycetales bacterium]|nr:hypothetical protein [Planctomycetales bacterium]
MAFNLSFGPFRNESRLLSVVDRVSARAQNAVWQRVRDRVLNMGVHEARGYIRARAALVIEREMAIAAGEEPTLSASHLSEINDAVRHRVVRRLLFESIRRHDSIRERRRRLAA